MSRHTYKNAEMSGVATEEKQYRSCPISESLCETYLHGSFFIRPQTRNVPRHTGIRGIEWSVRNALNKDCVVYACILNYVPIRLPPGGNERPRSTTGRCDVRWACPTQPDPNLISLIPDRFCLSLAWGRWLPALHCIILVTE
jgi:hypothetical protein